MNSDIDRQVRYFDSFKSACVYAKHQAIKNKIRYRIKKQETKSAQQWRVQAEDLEKVIFNEANNMVIQEFGSLISASQGARQREEEERARQWAYQEEQAKDGISFWVDGNEMESRRVLVDEGEEDWYENWYYELPND